MSVGINNSNVIGGVRVSELKELPQITGSEYFYVITGGFSRKVSYELIYEAVLSNVSKITGGTF